MACERLADSSSGTGMPKASETTCLIVATETGVSASGRSRSVSRTSAALAGRPVSDA